MIMSNDQHLASAEGQISMKTVLVVEDDEDIGELIVQAIDLETPFRALLVTDGFQALKRVNNLKPNLFLLDYGLPDTNGIKLYDALHAISGLEHVPAIMISANLPTQEVKKRRLLSLKKPFELDELLHIIGKVID
jgi:DNA-binding response OmpR family regulator